MSTKPNNYWHMQMFDSDENRWKDEVNETQMLMLSFIGIGWKDDLYYSFCDEMQKGDIILVRNGGEPKALVRVIGDVEENVKKHWEQGVPEWLKYIRKVKLLEYYDEYDKEPNGAIQAPGTLTRCNNLENTTSKFITTWYSDYLLKELSMENKMKEIIALLQANKNIILTGAPGTGKTYLAKEIAKKMIETPSNNEQKPKLTLTKGKYSPPEKSLAWWHEEIFNILYGYHEQHKDFMFTMREGRTGERIKKGYWFLGAENKPYVCVGLTLRGDAFHKTKVLYLSINLKNTKEAEDRYEIKRIHFGIAFSDKENSKLLEYHDALLKIFDGEKIKERTAVQFAIIDHTGNLKEVLEKTITKYWGKLNEVMRKYDLENCINQEKLNIFLANRKAVLASLGADDTDDVIDEDRNEDQIKLVQFHPSYDYTDFVEGLRPIKNEGNSKEISFERQDGVFKKFCKDALNNENKKFIFIIDEINRGEVNKIFGELFYSLDPDYRGKKGHVRTQYQNLITSTDEEDEDEFADEFYVPENVYIIGTMNDIDRSVESFDFALRRRFVWYEITAADSQVMLENNPKLDGVNISEIKNRMNKLNAQIAAIPGLGTAYQIGAAYFLKLTHYKTDTGVDFEKLWKLHLRPLLSEYLRGFDDINTKIEELKTAYNKTDIQ